MVGPVPPPHGGIASMMQDILHSELSHEYVFEQFDGPFEYPPGVTDPIRKNIIRAKKYLNFYSKCRRGQYSFMHIHSPGEQLPGNAVYMFLARLAGMKVLLHLHGNDWERFYLKSGYLKKIILRTGLCLASGIIVLRDVWKEEIERLGVRAKVRVVKNTIPMTVPPDETVLEETRNWAGVKKDDFVVLLAGAGIVGHDKGFFDLVDAIPLILRQENAIKFLLAGAEEQPGQMMTALNMIENRKLGEWIKLLGDVEREKVSILMEIASVFLLPSYIEGMPISVIEAMRSNAVVVATPVGAIPEMIADGITGILIPVGSPNSIASVVLELKNNTGLRLKMAEAAKIDFAERFELSRGVADLRSIYKELEEDSQKMG